MSFRAPALVTFACLGCLVSACSPDVTISTNPTIDPKPVPWQPSMPEAHPIQCDPSLSSDPHATILAFARGNDLVFASASGDRTVVHTFASGASAPWIQVAARGAFVAAIASSVSSDGTIAGEAILLTHDGAVLWSTSANESFDTLQLGVTGELVIGTSLGTSLVVTPDGATQTIDGVAPAGPPDAQGRFAVLITADPNETALGFFDPSE